MMSSAMEGEANSNANSGETGQADNNTSPPDFSSFLQM